MGIAYIGGDAFRFVVFILLGARVSEVALCVPLQSLFVFDTS